MTTASIRARTAAFATALLCTTGFMSAAAAEPPQHKTEDTQLAAGIGLMILGSGALAASTVFAMARELEDNEILDDPAGPSGGTLAIIGAIGLAGVAVGVGLTVMAAEDELAPKRGSKPKVSAVVTPTGAALRIRF